AALAASGRRVRHERAQRQGVVGRVSAGVVVEVHEDVARFPVVGSGPVGPPADESRPLPQLGLGVGAVIEHLRAVETDVDEPGPVLQPLVVPSGEGESVGRRPGKRVEEGLQELRVEALALGELPQDRAEAGAEGEDARREEVRQCLLDVLQSQHVADVA
ncbi:unnamed protein product, partial [Penicillium discolor]